mmetsp:Transcript_11770/g.33206  ORF Transcript_11770/g.33206 Transcript_11770/m.33206 type:complete len:255 (-) Transcript_11770:1219-1983(-)
MKLNYFPVAPPVYTPSIVLPVTPASRLAACTTPGHDLSLSPLCSLSSEDQGCENGTVLLISKLTSAMPGVSRSATHSCATSSLEILPLRTSPCPNSTGMPLGSSVSAQGRTIQAPMPLSRSASSEASLYVSRPPSMSFIFTAGGSCSTSTPGRFQRVTPALDTMTARGRLGSSTYALMYWMGSSKAPSDHLGLSWPSYSNLLSISCTLDRWSLTSTNGFFDPSVMVFARNTGMRPENGIRIVCQAPGTVSNEHV